jgi:hypothetical protein
VPGAAERARPFELSQLGWATGSTASSEAAGPRGRGDKAEAAARSITRPP